MRLLIFFLTASLVFGQNSDQAISALTDTIVGLDQNGIEQLNTSLDQQNAGVLLTGSDDSESSIINTEISADSQTEEIDNTTVSQSATNSLAETVLETNTQSTPIAESTSNTSPQTNTNSSSASTETTSDSVCLVPYIPWSEGLFFLSEYKGEDPRIAKIMETWSDPIGFYYKYGIGTLPTELNQQLGQLGINVVYDKSHKDLLYDLESGQCAILPEDESQSSFEESTQDESDDIVEDTEVLEESLGSELHNVESEDIPILKQI